MMTRQQVRANNSMRIIHRLSTTTCDPALDVSPDGSLLAVSGYHEILLHRTADIEKDANTPPAARFDRLIRADSVVGLFTRWKFIGHGWWLTRSDGEIQVWNVAERKLVLAKTMTYDTLYGVSWSPEEQRLALVAVTTVSVRSCQDREQILFQGAHSDWVLATTFSKDGSHLVSASRDRSLKLIEVAEQTLRR